MDTWCDIEVERWGFAVGASVWNEYCGRIKPLVPISQSVDIEQLDIAT